MSEVSETDLRQMLSRVAELEAGRRSTFTNRLLQRVGPTRPFVAFYRRFGPMVDPWLLRKTGGRIATHVYGFPALLLYSIGAKTGRQRTTPLLYARDDDDFLVVGTNFGTKHHPAWTGNLLKNRDVQVFVGTDTIPVHATLLDEAAFKLHWPKFSQVYDGYDKYLERLTERTPRMFRLRPTAR